jgi:hypothetical protein
MGLPPELKIRRFKFFFFKIRPKLKDSPPKIHPPTSKIKGSTPLIYGFSYVLPKGSTLPLKRDAWKKLRKERKKFSKLLIFSTDCSQSMGQQSVIKIRGKTSKLFALHASPYKGSSTYWILVALKIHIK